MFERFGIDAPNRWDKAMDPLKREQQRNNLRVDINRKLSHLVHRGDFLRRSFTTNDLTVWDNPEDRINEAFKRPGFWYLPPEVFGFKEMTFKNRSLLTESYQIPTNLLMNETLLDFLKDENSIIEQKEKLNKAYGRNKYPVYKKLRCLEFEISKKSNRIHQILQAYANSLIDYISETEEIKDYDKACSDFYSRLQVLEETQDLYYASYFGSEFIIAEEISFFIEDELLSEHGKLINELIPLAKAHYIHQVLEKHFKKPRTGDWEKSKDLVSEILNCIGKQSELDEESIIMVLKRYYPNYIPPTGSKSLVNISSDSLIKSQVADALAQILKYRLQVDSITGDYLKRKIDSQQFIFECTYWKKYSPKSQKS